MKTNDNNLLLKFTYHFNKLLPSFVLVTEIKNTGTVPMRVIYKRIVDWDVCGNKTNNWESTETTAYAWSKCGALSGKNIQLSLSEGLSPDRYVDLYAWDDQNFTGIGKITQSIVPIKGDYNAGMTVQLGPELQPGEGRSILTSYQSNFPKIK